MLGRYTTIHQVGLKMKLERSMSARRDFRSYALLFVGLVFVWAGATVDPAKNCDESGRQCAPWLVPIAFCMGVLAATAGMAMLVTNNKWGSRLDLMQRRLYWWDTRQSPEMQSISIDDVARIEVRIVSDSSDNILFYDRNGALMPIPKEEIFPHTYEAWVRDLVAHFPHIAVEVKNG